MKKIICFSLFSIYFGHSQSYKFENDELKENVQSLELFISDKYTTEKLVEHKTFDKKGRILISKRYDGEWIRNNERNQYYGNQIITEFCDSCKDLDKAFANFSDKGNQEYPYKGYATNNPSRTFKIVKTTDKNGNVISSKTYNSEGYFIWETKYTYDKKSNPLLEETFDDEGEKNKEYKKNTYNKKGLLTEKITHNTQFEEKYIFEYDNLNRKIFEKRFFTNEVTETTFKYDDLGRIISEKYSSNYEIVYEYTTIKDTLKVIKYYIDAQKNKRITNVKTSYNKGKNKVIEEQQFNEKGETSHTKIVEYDENKNLILSKFSNSVGYAENKEIIYDKKGNWIELNLSKLVKVGYNGSEPKPEWQTEKYIRKIQYY